MRVPEPIKHLLHRRPAFGFLLRPYRGRTQPGSTGGNIRLRHHQPISSGSCSASVTLTGSRVVLGVNEGVAGCAGCVTAAGGEDRHAAGLESLQGVWWSSPTEYRSVRLLRQ